MKSMIVLLGAILVGGALGQHGPVHDTPEVAAAKAAHFAAVARAEGHGPHQSGWAGGPAPGAAGAWAGHGGAPAAQYTPEVAAARAAHLAALNSASAGGPQPWGQPAPSHNDDGQWHGEGVWNQGANLNDGQWHGDGAWNQAPQAALPVDTPEVAAARAAHLAALNSANGPQTWGQPAPSHNDDGQWHGEGVWNQAANHNDGQWNQGHQAGLPVDTPEVAAARAAHLAAHQQTGGHNRWRRSPARSGSSRASAARSTPPRAAPGPIPNSRPFPVEARSRAHARN